MRFIPTLIHGIADYLVGLITIALPFYFGWQGAPRIVFVVLGVAVLIYSFFTDYELGAVRVLSVRVHLIFDAVFGVALLVLPWLLDYPPDALKVSSVLGVLALILTATTKVHAEGGAAGRTGTFSSRP